MDYPLSMLLVGAHTIHRAGLFDVAVGTPNGVHLVDLRAGALVQRLAGPSRGTGSGETISSLAWDGQWTLYGGTELGRIVAWDVRRAEGQPHWTFPAMPQCITQMEWLGSPRAGHLLCGTIGGQSLGLLRLPDRREDPTRIVSDDDATGLGRTTATATATTNNNHQYHGPDDRTGTSDRIIWRTDGGRVPGTILSRWILTMDTMVPLIICPEARAGGGGGGALIDVGLRAYNGITGDLQWTRLTGVPSGEGPRGELQPRTGPFEHLLYDPRGLQLINANSVSGKVQFFPL